MALVRAALKAAVTAAAAPNAAARHHRGPRRAATMQPAMAPRRIDVGEQPTRAGWAGRCPPLGVGGQEEAGEPADDGGRTQPFEPAQPVAEPHGQDEQQEEELGGEDGLDDAELAEAEGGGLQPEDHQHEREADQPDATPEGMGHEAEPQGARWPVPSRRRSAAAPR